MLLRVRGDDVSHPRSAVAVADVHPAEAPGLVRPSHSPSASCVCAALAAAAVPGGTGESIPRTWPGGAALNRGTGGRTEPPLSADPAGLGAPKDWT